MQGTLQVTPEKLISASSEFSNSSSQLKNTTTQMAAIVDGLSSVWTGEAATSYKSKFHELDDDVQMLHKRIQEHTTDLADMARVFQEAERKAQEAAGSLQGVL